MPYHGFSEAFLKSIITQSLNTSEPGIWNVTRHYMYTRIAGILGEYDGAKKDCLSISHSDMLARLLGLEKTRITQANYPEHNMLELSYPEGRFDFCISDQVLEHVEGNPFTAFAETAKVIRKGGFVAHTTCFMNEVHGTPKDFWRFTPDALRLLADHCGLRIVDCGGWGNKDVWTYMELGFRTARVPLDPEHPICQMAMVNDETIPIVTWVIAQK